MSTFIKNIAIVGAGGHVGQHITKALLEKSKFNVSAITRHDSTNPIPSGVSAKKVDYNNKESLVNALKGEDVLIITMNVRAPQDQQAKLIEAAAEANVPFILPNEWGYDNTVEPQTRDYNAPTRNKIKELGKSSYIAMNCGFWYQFSLAHGPDAFGFDFKKKLVLYDDGNTKLDVSTWPQVGRAVANLLSFKVKPDGPNDQSPSLEQFKNKHVRFNSFSLSQRDMLAAVLAVSGEKESDWKISYQNVEERYTNAVKEMQAGNHQAYVVSLYARMFYKDEPGCMEKKHGVHNAILALPKEDLLVETKQGVERAAQDVKYN